jgi:hypothetical protein
MATIPSGAPGYGDAYPEFPLNYIVPTTIPVAVASTKERTFNSVEIGVISTAIAITVITIGLLISIARR